MVRPLRFSATVAVVFAAANDEYDCASGLTCLPSEKCKTINDGNTVFPCGANKICCKPLGNTTTTIKPPRNYTGTIWEGIPKNMWKKVELLPESCGSFTVDNRLSGGEDAVLEQFPWMVLIGSVVDNVPQFWCGGTLINNRTILTAAHCITAENTTVTTVRLGEWDTSTNPDCVDGNVTNCAPPVVDIPIKKITVHPKYGNKKLASQQNDIALITINKDVKFSANIKPICLTPKIEESMYYTVAGWGFTNNDVRELHSILQFAPISLYNFDDCNGLAPPEVKPLSNTQFCAGGDSVNSCKGDSGGPLSFESLIDGKTYQKGIVSLSTSLDCESEGQPRIYTEVSKYIIWILRNLT